MIPPLVLRAGTFGGGEGLSEGGEGLSDGRGEGLSDGRGGGLSDGRDEGLSEGGRPSCNTFWGHCDAPATECTKWMT